MRITKILLEQTADHYRLMTVTPDLPKGYVVTDQTKVITGKALAGLIKYGTKRAKSLGVPFEHRVA